MMLQLMDKKKEIIDNIKVIKESEDEGEESEDESEYESEDESEESEDEINVFDFEIIFTELNLAILAMTFLMFLIEKNFTHLPFYILFYTTSMSVKNDINFLSIRIYEYECLCNYILLSHSAIEFIILSKFYYLVSIMIVISYVKKDADVWFLKNIKEIELSSEKKANILDILFCTLYSCNLYLDMTYFVDYYIDEILRLISYILICIFSIIIFIKIIFGSEIIEEKIQKMKNN